MLDVFQPYRGFRSFENICLFQGSNQFHKYCYFIQRSFWLSHVSDSEELAFADSCVFPATVSHSRICTKFTIASNRSHLTSRTVTIPNPRGTRLLLALWFM